MITDSEAATSNKTREVQTKRAFARDAFVHSASNVLYLCITAVTTFLLPRIVTVRAFGLYRLFLLIAGYMSVIHLGTLDGALIRWAKNPRGLIHREVPPVATFMLGVEFAILIPVCIIAFLYLDRPKALMVLAVALITIVVNALSLGQYILQATRRFDALSALTVVLPAILLTFILGLIGLHQTGATGIVSASLLANAAVVVLYLAACKREFTWRWPSFRETWSLARQHLHLGFTVMLANFVTVFIVSSDRLFVSARFPIEDFAVYSFAATIFYSVNLVMLAVARVVFPYLSLGISVEKRDQAFRMGRTAIVALWSVGLASYFPAYWLVLHILPVKYAPSVGLIRILVLGTGASAQVQVIHFNFFRVHHEGARMFLGSVVGLVAVLGLLFWAQRYGNLVFIAYAMTVGVLLWWLLNEVLLCSQFARPMRNVLINVAYMAVAATGFLVASAHPAPANCGLYLTGACGFAWAICPKTVRTALWRR